MEQGDLEKYREENGYINWNKVQEENPNIIYEEEPRGTARRNKVWYTLEDGVKILLRDEEQNLKENGVIYTTYQELIFEELAKQVEFPCAHYDLVERDGKKGVISYSVLNGDEYKKCTTVSLAELMDQIKCSNAYDHSYDVGDALRAISSHCKESGIEDEECEEIMNDFMKLQVLDSFLGSTDRHCENISFICGLDEKTEKPIIKLAPAIDNEFSCGSERIKDEMDLVSADSREAKLFASFDQVCCEVPNKYIFEYINGAKFDGNQKITAFCMENSEEAENFASICMDRLDIAKAMESVEKRINAPIPDEYKQFLLTLEKYRKNIMQAMFKDFYNDTPSDPAIM